MMASSLGIPDKLNKRVRSSNYKQIRMRIQFFNYKKTVVLKKNLVRILYINANDIRLK